MRRISRSLSVVAALAASAVVLAGCSSTASDSGSESTDAASSDVLGTVETMFGTVEVPQPEDELKVVALGWSDAEMALALGVKPIAVYDWQAFGADNKGVGPWATELFGDETPEIIENAGDALNYEAIQALDPDVILNTRSDNDEKVFDRLSEIAPTVYAPEGTAAFATSWDTQLTSVSEALGLADEGTALVEETQTAIDAVATEHPEFGGLTTVAATKFGDQYGAYLAGDGRFDLLASFGFVQNPAVEALEPAGFYATVSAEDISVFDADVAVVLPIGFTAAQVEADPLIASLKVVQDGRAVFLDADNELSGAYSAASALSIPVVLEGLVPLLADAAAKVAK